jgi:hypothetical protein
MAKHQRSSSNPTRMSDARNYGFDRSAIPLSRMLER